MLHRVLAGRQQKRSALMNLSVSLPCMKPLLHLRQVRLLLLEDLPLRVSPVICGTLQLLDKQMLL